MRRNFRTAAIVLTGLGLTLGLATASQDEQAPETRAYLGFSFGGKKVIARDFHYGLRVDHDSYYAGQQTLPSVIQLDFTKRGLNDFRVHGLSAIKPEYRLRQAEEAAAEEAPVEDEVVEGAEEEGGFFSGIADWFGGLFGGDEEVVADEAAATAEAATETAEAAEAAEAEVEEVPAEGAFLGYNAIDWGLVAVGAAGLGFAATEVVDGDDEVRAGGTTTGGTTTGGGPAPPVPDCLPPPFPPGMCNPTLVGRKAALSYEQHLERQRWLDGGTGQMGDLGG